MYGLQRKQIEFVKSKINAPSLYQKIIEQGISFKNVFSKCHKIYEIELTHFEGKQVYQQLKFNQLIQEIQKWNIIVQQFKGKEEQINNGLQRQQLFETLAKLLQEITFINQKCFQVQYLNKIYSWYCQTICQKPQKKDKIVQKKQQFICSNLNKQEKTLFDSQFFQKILPLTASHKMQVAGTNFFTQNNKFINQKFPTTSTFRTSQKFFNNFSDFECQIRPQTTTSCIYNQKGIRYNNDEHAIKNLQESVQGRNWKSAQQQKRDELPLFSLLDKSYLTPFGLSCSDWFQKSKQINDANGLNNQISQNQTLSKNNVENQYQNIENNNSQQDFLITNIENQRFCVERPLSQRVKNRIIQEKQSIQNFNRNYQEIKLSNFSKQLQKKSISQPSYKEISPKVSIDPKTGLTKTIKSSQTLVNENKIKFKNQLFNEKSITGQFSKFIKKQCCRKGIQQSQKMQKIEQKSLQSQYRKIQYNDSEKQPSKTLQELEKEEKERQDKKLKIIKHQIHLREQNKKKQQIDSLQKQNEDFDSSQRYNADYNQVQKKLDNEEEKQNDENSSQNIKIPENFNEEDIEIPYILLDDSQVNIQQELDSIKEYYAEYFVIANRALSLTNPKKKQLSIEDINFRDTKSTLANTFCFNVNVTDSLFINNQSFTQNILHQSLDYQQQSHQKKEISNLDEQSLQNDSIQKPNNKKFDFEILNTHQKNDQMINNEENLQVIDMSKQQQTKTISNDRNLSYRNKYVSEYKISTEKTNNIKLLYSSKFTPQNNQRQYHNIQEQELSPLKKIKWSDQQKRKILTFGQLTQDDNDFLQKQLYQEEDDNYLKQASISLYTPNNQFSKTSSYFCATEKIKKLRNQRQLNFQDHPPSTYQQHIEDDKKKQLQEVERIKYKFVNKKIIIKENSLQNTLMIPSGFQDKKLNNLPFDGISLQTNKFEQNIKKINKNHRIQGKQQPEQIIKNQPIQKI